MANTCTPLNIKLTHLAIYSLDPELSFLLVSCRKNEEVYFRLISDTVPTTSDNAAIGSFGLFRLS